MLQAFEPETTSYIGVADGDSSRGIGVGLIRRATIIGFEEDNRLFFRSLEMPTVQLIELKLLNVSLVVVSVCPALSSSVVVMVVVNYASFVPAACMHVSVTVRQGVSTVSQLVAAYSDAVEIDSQGLAAG
jgi:hypothetical protein